MRGRFITFEGGEGTGKSTQAALLANRLRLLFIAVELTREPGGSPGAEIIRHILLSGIAKPLGPEAETILFAAARDDHLRNTIVPALEQGKWVICDRFSDSTRVYQGVLGNVDPRLIKALERVTVGETMPDVTFILDLPAEEGLARAHRRRGDNETDRFESESLEFHQKLRKAYLELVKDNPQRCILIDASQPRDEVAKRIWREVSRRLSPSTAAVAMEEAAR
jgi:dTMP kinase